MRLNTNGKIKDVRLVEVIVYMNRAWYYAYSSLTCFFNASSSDVRPSNLHEENCRLKLFHVM